MPLNSSAPKTTYRAPALWGVMAISLLTAPAFAQTDGCSDDFTMSRIGTDQTWTFLDADNATGGSATVLNGKLELAGRGADIYGNRNQFVAVYRKDITGDFDLSVKIDSQDSVHTWAQAGFIVANDLADLTKGGYAVLNVSPGNGFNFFFDRAEPRGQLDGLQGGGRTAYPAWLRIAKAGTQFSAWYKTQASANWTAITPTLPASLGTASNSHIGLFTVSHDINKTGKTVFDEFNCLSATVSLAPKHEASSHGRKTMGQSWVLRFGKTFNHEEGEVLPRGLIFESTHHDLSARNALGRSIESVKK